MPRDVILECMRLAIQAPTASNAQDWRWLVVTDADKRAAIAEIYRSVGAEYLAHAASTATDPQTQRVYQSAAEFTDTLAKVPVHVIPCLEGRFDGSNQLVAASAMGVDHSCRLEFPARTSITRSGIGVDDDASGQGARGR